MIFTLIACLLLFCLYQGVDGVCATTGEPAKYGWTTPNMVQHHHTSEGARQIQTALPRIQTTAFRLCGSAPWKMQMTPTRVYCRR